MKKKILFLFILALTLAVSLVLTSCDSLSLPGVNNGTNGGNSGDTGNGSGGNGTGDTGTGDGSGSGDGTNDENGDGTGTTPEPVYYTVKYIYDDEGMNETFTILRQKVEEGKTFTKEQLDEKDAKLYHGYDLQYYSDSKCITPFDFSATITKDTTVYCGRDITKAGKNVTWSVEEQPYSTYQNPKYKLVFEGEGDMYKYLYYDTDVPWWSDYYLFVDEIEIAEGITSIADCAFYQFKEISDVTIPESIKYIGASSFFGSSISSINFPANLETIGNAAFRECVSLVHLDFNKGLQLIGDSAFYRCTSIETVVLTDTIMTFGTSAFQECTALSSAYYIGTEEQYKAINIRLDNFWIDELAHTYYISDNEPSAPGPYWYYNEDGEICQWYYTIWYMSSKKETVPFCVDYVDVEEGITQDNIDFLDNIVYHGYRFDHWRMDNSRYTMRAGTVLTKDIKLVGNRGYLCGDNVKWHFSSNILTISKIDSSIDDGAMWDFETVLDAPWNGYNIHTVVISDGITHIGKFAFVDIMNKESPYSSFSYFDIPTCVTSIDEEAFSGCAHLLYIYYAGTHEDIYGNAATGTQPRIAGLASLKAPNTTVYANATGLSFASLGEGSYWANIEGDGMTRRVAWSYKNGTLRVGGGDRTHIMINYLSHADTPWYSYRDQVREVIIMDNITTVGHHSFEGMSNVKSILASANIRKVSGSAFVGTGYYNDMYNDTGVVYIYNMKDGEGVDTTFRYAHLIKVNPAKIGETFIIPEKTLSIADNAFEGCSSIKNIIMTKDISINGIYSTAFNGLTALEKLYYEGNSEAWNNYDNTQTGSGELLEAIVVYYFSAFKPAEAGNYWYWNSNKTAPELWVFEE